MWTPEDQTKSIHTSEVSPLMKLGLAMGHSETHLNASYKEANWPGKKCPHWRGVHKGKVSTGWGSTVLANLWALNFREFWIEGFLALKIRGN